ncbi:hypothetical protein ACFXAZ_33230 [Streptomyces sp. NPDC059477]|uniref:hypothetical protein n=1 Tax=Streptomyces sp. NPDC059477 TaxID=3346847 RepID=UPI0036AD6040
MTNTDTLGPVLSFAAQLAVQHPSLPSGAPSFHTANPKRLTLCLGGPAEVEVWREALHVSPDAVRFEERGGHYAFFVGFHAEVEGFEVDAFVCFNSADLAKQIAAAQAQEQEGAAA